MVDNEKVGTDLGLMNSEAKEEQQPTEKADVVSGAFGVEEDVSQPHLRGGRGAAKVIAAVAGVAVAVWAWRRRQRPRSRAERFGHAAGQFGHAVGDAGRHARDRANEAVKAVRGKTVRRSGLKAVAQKARSTASRLH